MNFNGFPKDTTKFLSDLAKNNNRDWFTENKNRYKTSVEAPTKEFLDTLVSELSDLAKEPLAGKIFRIYRDVRFSKDKTPYNAHIRILLHSIQVESSCGNKPVFCLSIEPKKIITGIGTGTMEFTKESLQTFRDSIADNKHGAALEKLLKKFDAKDGYRIDPPALKRVPAPFDSDHPRADLLRHKALMIWHEEKIPADLYSPKLPGYLTRRYKKMMPIYQWINAL